MDFNPIIEVYIGGAGGFVACLDYNLREININHTCFKGSFIKSLCNYYKLAIL